MTVPDPGFLEVADKIGRRLCRDALWAGDQCNWLGWAMMPNGRAWNLAYRAQPATLYDGTAGIALFLARLYRCTQDPLLKATLQGALNRSLAEAPAMTNGTRSSIYNGLAGIAYTSIEAGQLLEHERLVSEGLSYLHKLGRIDPDSNNELDVCTGSAGTIQVLLNVAARFEPERESLVAAARAHGERLIKQAVKTDAGWSWDTMPGNSREPLLGYAHGTAGIACALLELSAATGDEQFKAAALEAFRYERAHFDATQRNWPDLRKSDQTGIVPDPPTFMVAWCHGAPGIALSRLRAYQLMEFDETLGTELQVALQTTVDFFTNSLAYGHGNYCLCHGAGGNAEVLLIAADVLGRPELRQSAETVGRNGSVLYHMTDSPWPCGVSVGVETPNLMLGLAGIGHFYLRLYDSVGVPSVLLITPN